VFRDHVLLAEHLFEDESWFQQVLEEVFVKNFCTSALESSDKQDEESIAINSDAY
jgi:hypothetical protein